MSTDELRELWRKFRDKSAGEEKYSEEDILQILKNRAELSLRRLNNSIYFETFMTLLALLLITFFLAQFGSYLLFRVFLILVIVLIGLYFVLIGWIYVKLNHVALIARDLRRSLEKKVFLLKGFIRSYFWMNMILAPVIFPLAVYAGYFAGKTEDQDAIQQVLLTNSEYFWLIVVSFVLIGVFYPFLRWYINKLYGKHVKELEKCLESLSHTNGA